MRIKPYPLIFPALLVLWFDPTGPAAPYPPVADAQFVGDIFVSERSLTMLAEQSGKASSRLGSDPTVFTHLEGFLAQARHNIANLEGVITKARPSQKEKEHLLKMPESIPTLLSGVGINAVTLANNHAMDFGLAGLLDSLKSLAAAGIATAGADLNRSSAWQPLKLKTSNGALCVIPLSRSLPESFWATDDQAGSAFATDAETDELVRHCKRDGSFTVVSYHWGQENKTEPKIYQRQFAQRAIDAGADAVVGHHPHVLQGIEVYKGRLIIYSLGNFVFGTFPKHSKPQGLAARLFLTSTGDMRWDLIPLLVDNTRVHLQPRPYRAYENAEAKALLPELPQCPWVANERLWRCILPATSTKATSPRVLSRRPPSRHRSQSQL